MKKIPFLIVAIIAGTITLTTTTKSKANAYDPHACVLTTGSPGNFTIECKNNGLVCISAGDCIPYFF